MAEHEVPEYMEWELTTDDCWECGQEVIHRVWEHHFTRKQKHWYACPNCGFESRLAKGKKKIDCVEPWYLERYGPVWNKCDKQPNRSRNRKFSIEAAHTC
jgi:predicted RNA-binding Zn-ribbon protein involved in translation (DUF1610 family)